MGAQTFKGIGIWARKGSNQTNGSKIIYWCYIYSSFDHRIHDCPHKQIAMEMFKGKGSIIELQKEKVVVNMALIMTSQSKAITQEDLKEKEPQKPKTQMDWTEK